MGRDEPLRFHQDEGRSYVSPQHRATGYSPERKDEQSQPEDHCGEENLKDGDEGTIFLEP